MARQRKAPGARVPAELLLTPATVANRLGIAVATLRSWDRRHGLGLSTHEPGKHRRYTAEDVRRLERLVRLIRQGVAVSSAAAVVRAEASGDAVVDLPTVPDQLVPRRLRALRHAADALDPAAVRRIIIGLLGERGVVYTWQRVLVPFLVELGERCGKPHGPIEVEHLATDGIIAALHATPPVAPLTSASTVLACAPGEQHTLPLEALRHALADHGMGSLLLGARVPSDALLNAIRTRAPADVVVWAHTARLARRVPVAAALELGAGVVAAGPGWSGLDLPESVRRPASLADAVELLRERPSRASGVALV